MMLDHASRPVSMANEPCTAESVPHGSATLGSWALDSVVREVRGRESVEQEGERAGCARDAT